LCYIEWSTNGGTHAPGYLAGFSAVFGEWKPNKDGPHFFAPSDETFKSKTESAFDNNDDAFDHLVNILNDIVVSWADPRYNGKGSGGDRKSAAYKNQIQNQGTL
jgi:hypothetical protein